MQNNKYAENYIYNTVCDVLEKYIDKFDPDLIDHDSYIKHDLGGTSLEIASVLSELENIFEIKIPKDLETDTVRDLCNAVSRQLDIKQAVEATKKKDIFGTVVKIIKQDKEDITDIDESSFFKYDLNFDSSDMADLLVQIEEHFKISELPDFKSMQTIKDLCNEIALKLTEKANANKQIKRKKKKSPTSEKIKEIIKSQGFDEKLTLKTSLRKDLNMDNTDILELYVLLGREFNIDEPEHANIDTIQDVREYVFKNKKQKAITKRILADIVRIIDVCTANKNYNIDNIKETTYLKNLLSKQDEAYEQNLICEKISDEFGVDIYANIDKCKTVRDLCYAVATKMSERKKPVVTKTTKRLLPKQPVYKTKDITEEILKTITPDLRKYGFVNVAANKTPKPNASLSFNASHTRHGLAMIIKSYGIDISQDLDQVKTCKDLCTVIINKLVRTNKNSKQKILDKMMPDLQKYGFIRQNDNTPITMQTPLYLGAATPYMYFVLENIIKQKFDIEVGQNIFKITDCDSLCEVINQARLEQFRLHKAFVQDAKEAIIEEGNVQDPITNKYVHDISYAKKMDSNATLSWTYNVNSLDIAEALIRLENKYGYPIKVKDWYDVDSIEDMWRTYLESKKEYIAQKQTVNVFESVKSIILDVCTEIANKEIKDEDITPKCSLKSDLGLDELDSEQIVLAFEEKHHFKIHNTDTINKVTSMEDFCNLLEAYMYNNIPEIRRIEEKYTITPLQRLKKAWDKKIALMKASKQRAK